MAAQIYSKYGRLKQNKMQVVIDKRAGALMWWVPFFYVYLIRHLKVATAGDNNLLI